MNAIEHQLANPSAAQTNISVDTHTREIISRIEQQMKLLSISIGSGSQSSNVRNGERVTTNSYQ